MRTTEPSESRNSETVARIDVWDLMRGKREVILVYKGGEYRLRLTSNDKLILTK